VAGLVLSVNALLDVEETLAPFACGRIRAEEEHEDGGARDEDERYDERDSPCNVGGEATVPDKAVEDGGHYEIGDTTTSVTETTGKCVRSTNDIL